MTSDDIDLKTARVTIKSQFGTFTQDQAISRRDCYVDPHGAAKIIAESMAKCVMGRVLSVEVV